MALTASQLKTESRFQNSNGLLPYTKEIRFPVVGTSPDSPGENAGGAGSLSGVGIADLTGDLVGLVG